MVDLVKPRNPDPGRPCGEIGCTYRDNGERGGPASGSSGLPFPTRLPELNRVAGKKVNRILRFKRTENCIIRGRIV